MTSTRPRAAGAAPRARRRPTEAAADAVRAAARGDADMTDCQTARSAGELAGGQPRRASPPASRPSASCWCTCCSGSGPASRCCSSTRSITSRRPIAYRDEIAGRWNLNLVNLRAAEPRAGPVAARARRRAAARTRSSRCSRALAGLRRVVHRPAARSSRRRRADLAGDRAVRAADRQGAAQGQPARAVDDEGRVELRARRTTFRCCRSTTAATPASAASRARRCRPNRATSGRAAGRGQKLECGIHIDAVK